MPTQRTMQMTHGGPRQPGESEGAYMKRMGEWARELEKQRKRQRRDDPRLERVQEDDKLLDALGGKNPPKGGDELSQMLGAWRNDIDSEPLSNITQGMPEQAARDLKRYRETKNPRTKKKLAKKNKGAWKDAAKKNKKSKGGCAVIAVALLGVGGGALWGIYEAGSAIVSALGH